MIYEAQITQNERSMLNTYLILVSLENLWICILEVSKIFIIINLKIYMFDVLGKYSYDTSRYIYIKSIQHFHCFKENIRWKCFVMICWAQCRE